MRYCSQILGLDETLAIDPRYLFFFNDTATTEIYTLSLHDALPIWRLRTRGSVLPDRPKMPCARSPRFAARRAFACFSTSCSTGWQQTVPASARPTAFMNAATIAAWSTLARSAQS